MAYSRSSLRDGSGLDPSRAMNVLCWNCLGIGNPWTVNGLKRVISLNIPDIIFLCETRCLKQDVERLKLQVNYKNVFVVDCDNNRNSDGKVSRAGGICLLWKEGVEVSLSTFSKNHIDVMVGKAGARDKWRFSGVYGFSKVEERYKTWELLRRLGQSSGRPWLIGGDLNSEGNREGGRPPKMP
ncbi:hypothetical protein ACLB2K_004365 [Fragaria x ananassa]